MSAAAAAALKKIAAFILSDKELRGKLFVIIGSIVCGVLGLLCLPVVVIASLGNMEIEPPQIDKNQFNQSAFIESLDSESQAKLVNLQNRGQAIEDAMSGVDCKEQIIKAQLIYLSFFDGVQNFNAQSYANLFKKSIDDKALIDALNSAYGLKIDYNEFMKSYTWVMNSTMNQYMFSDSKSKNAADLAAWAENAYTSGWGFKESSYGEIDTELGYRCADNVGLIMGYLRYNAAEKSFNIDVDTLIYDEIYNIDTIPDVQGLGVYNSTDFGIYVGSDEVISSSVMDGYVTKSSTDDWESWCIFNDIEYPKEVLDAIEEIRNSPETTAAKSEVTT